MKKLIREIFFLRKGERRALYFVLIMLLLSALARVYFANRPLPAFDPDPVFVQHMEEIQRKIDSALQVEQRTEVFASGREGTQRSLAPVPFDPNTVSYDTLVAMNLSGFVSRNIISYRNAGGTFRKPGDLEKIYGLTKENLRVLAPYMVFPEQVAPASAPDGGSRAGYRFNSEFRTGADRRSGTEEFRTPVRRADTAGRSGSSGWPGADGSRFYPPEYDQAWKDTLYPLDLNSIDSAGLIALPGIGPWFAGRITRYRELLGGYVHPEQLLEVYGMDTTRFSGMIRYVTADTALVRRIDLNNCTFQQIISHPYISREEAYAIFRYKDFTDSISQPENLILDQIIDRDRFMRMSPYLTTKSMEE
jgi:DNA uptake protein ComE-like DNA-binding protein